MKCSGLLAPLSWANVRHPRLTAMIVPLGSSRATAMVRASRMLWAEGIGVAVSECRCGCMALVVRASEPLGLGLDEGVPAWDQRTRTEAVQDHLGVIGRV